MGANKKPRKRYVQKPAVLPAGMRKDIAFEMPGFQASEAMGKGHFQERHVYDLLSKADMTRRIAPDGHEILPVAQAMVEAIAEIQARPAHRHLQRQRGRDARAARGYRQNDGFPARRLEFRHFPGVAGGDPRVQ